MKTKLPPRSALRSHVLANQPVQGIEWVLPTSISETDAAVAVEQITTDLILASGGDDQVWPSAAFAQQIRARRAAYGMDTTVLHEPDAGHRVVLPGEPPAQPTQGFGYGGSEEADRRLGNRVLDALLASLPLAG